jgi:hypothetical protein
VFSYGLYFRGFRGGLLMKVLIGQCIMFNQDSVGDEFALICGPYRIEDMTMEDYYKWADKTTEDYITEDYDGEIHIAKNWEDLL